MSRQVSSEKALKISEMGAAASLALVVLSLGYVMQVPLDSRTAASKPGGENFVIYSDPPEAEIVMVNSMGESDHLIGITNSQTLSVQDFLRDGETKQEGWSYNVSLRKEGYAPGDLTVTQTHARQGVVPEIQKPIVKLSPQGPINFLGYLFGYRKGAVFSLFLGLLGALGFGWKALDERRKRKVLLRYEADPDSDSYVGKIVHGHLVTGVLGAGGYGKVYRVLDAKTLDEKSPKALKIISYELYEANKDETNASAIETELVDSKARFMREMELLGTADHPNICQVLDYGREKQHDWVIMPVYEKSLKDLLSGPDPISPETVMSVAKQVAEGLQYAHDQHITHRDLKPDNIMLAGERVVIIDFGIAKPKDKATITAFNSILGTTKYMAPEQISGNSEHTVDQYAYGLILFELLTKSFPYDLPSHDLEVLNQRLLESPKTLRTANPQYTEGLEKVISRMLEQTPERRYPNVKIAYEAFEESYLAGVISSGSAVS